MAYCVTGKVGHESEEHATATAIELIELRCRTELKTYRCPYCRQWHLTTAPVQLHDWWWRPEWQWPKRVKNWFKNRRMQLEGKTFGVQMMGRLG